MIATVAMSMPMLLARRLGLIDRQPPQEVTQRLVMVGGRRLAGPSLALATAAAHLSLGGLLGSAYVVVRGRVGPSGNRAWLGALYGILVWALAYPGILPRAGLVRGSRAAGPQRDVVMLAAHLVFGVTLEALGRPGAAERSLPARQRARRHGGCNGDVAPRPPA